jgi:hypothetical protein
LPVFPDCPLTVALPPAPDVAEEYGAEDASPDEPEYAEESVTVLESPE